MRGIEDIHTEGPLMLIVGTLGLVVNIVAAWTIASGHESMTAHVLVDPDLAKEDTDALLRTIRDIAREDHGIYHLTVQIEQSLSGCTEDHLVSYLLARVGKTF